MLIIYRIKKNIWKVLHVPLMTVRDWLVTARVINHKGRQDHHLGWIKQDATTEMLIAHLKHIHDFEDQRFAWIDSDQVVSLRKPHAEIFQYHLRIYSDGEVRGHYEFAPEARAIDHFLEIGFMDKSEDFQEWIQNFVIKK